MYAIVCLCCMYVVHMSGMSSIGKYIYLIACAAHTVLTNAVRKQDRLNHKAARLRAKELPHAIVRARLRAGVLTGREKGVDELAARVHARVSLHAVAYINAH